MKHFYLLSRCLALLLAFGVSSAWSQIIEFEYTGGPQEYEVPPGVSSIRVEAYGAEGYGNLGYGGYVMADLTVTGGEILQINVGGMGGTNFGGFNGGGTPGSITTYGGGGGASDIRSGGVDFEHRIIVAGGGGGSGSNCGTWTAEGGHGGGLIAMSGCAFSCSDCQYTGGGGTQVSGGIAGPTGHGSCGANSDGSLGLGGNNTGSNGTGGGGGYYGGGSGCFEGAGGGSSYTHPDAIDVVHEQGVRTGNGFISIEILCSGLELEATPTGVCAGESVTLTGTSVTGGVVTWDRGVENGESFVPPLGETIYTATSTSPEDCNLEVVVTSTEVPVLEAFSSSPAACAGTYITLWGEGGDTYEWDRGVENDVPFPAEEGVVTYTLTGSLLGCEAPPVTITLVGAPRPDASGTATPSEICLGESYVLTGDGDADTYNWGLGIEDGDALTPESPGTYTHIVIGNSDVGCGDTSMVTVTVHDLPEVNGGSDVAVCEGDEVTLTGSGTPTISWDMGITDGVAFAALAGETVYTVTGTNVNGCEDTDEVLVTGVEIPRITATDITPEYFGYDGEIDITVEGGSGEYTYAWSHGPITEDATSLTDGTYTVIINDITLEKGLCPMEATFTVGTELGIEDVELVELNVYPNPTTDRLVIVTTGTFNYDVLSLTGEVILQGQGTNQAELSMKELANGAYIIRVNANDKIGFAQVVKQ